MIERPKLWNRGYARASIMGHEATMNPTPAAAALLGSRRVNKAKAALRRLVRRPAHKGNPLPAIVGILGGLGGLSKRFKQPSEKRAAALAPQIVAAANAGNLMAARGLIERAAIPMKVAESNVWKAAAAQLSANTVAAVHKQAASIPQANQSGPEAFAASVLAAPTAVVPTIGAPASPAATLLGVLGQPGTVRAIASAARPRAQRRGRYPTYMDRYGRQRYSTRPPEAGEMRLPAGATPSPGTPYSFFQGAIGQGGALKTAGQLAVAGAAGVGAYLVTKRLLAALGGRAQSKEEAGVNAARAFRASFEDFKQQHGRYPTPAERVPMKAAYQQQLIDLGYDPVTFTRTRSGVESFLEDYNPLGG